MPNVKLYAALMIGEEPIVCESQHAILLRMWILVEAASPPWY
jgi:hypothetical protein